MKIETTPKVVGGLRVESVGEPMVSNRLIASSLVAYVIVAFLFDVTGWKSMFLNLLVMFLVYFGFNPNNRLKLKMEFAIVRRKYTNGEGDNDDNNGNLHRRAAGTPDQAN